MLSLRVDQQYSSILPELQYVVDIYNMSYTGIPDVVIGYGKANRPDIIINPGSALRFFAVKDPTPVTDCWFEWRRTRIPLLFQNKIPNEIISTDNDITIISADLLASAFYFLSLWQEVHSDVKDHLGRFPARESFLVQHDLVQYPVVNYYFDILNFAVEKVTHQKPAPRMQLNTNHQFTAVITHDIDQCRTGWKQDVYRALLDLRPWSALSAVFIKIFGRDIWFNFDTILELEQQFDAPAVFYFIPEHHKSGQYPNADYKITSGKMVKTIERLKQHGAEVGIHPSIGSGWDRKRFHAELNTFPGKVKSTRFHYLAFSLPDSFQLIDTSNLYYDSSLGFAEQTGFRSGFCYPYKPWDFVNRRAHTFYEFPFAIMDRTFINREYMNLTPEEAISIIRTLVDEVQKFAGMLTVLWHNNSFSGYKYRGWKEPFLWFLNEVLERNGRFSQPLAIIDELMDE